MDFAEVIRYSPNRGAGMIIELCTNCGKYCDGRGYCHECEVYTLIDEDEFDGEEEEDILVDKT